MSGLLFLAVVVVVSLLGGLVLWMRFREPRAWDSQMREFNRTLSALSPETPLPREGRRADRASARGRGPG